VFNGKAWRISRHRGSSRKRCDRFCLCRRLLEKLGDYPWSSRRFRNLEDLLLSAGHHARISRTIFVVSVTWSEYRGYRPMIVASVGLMFL
jgi:hypothetical protein